MDFLKISVLRYDIWKIQFVFKSWFLGKIWLYSTNPTLPKPLHYLDHLNFNIFALKMFVNVYKSDNIKKDGA